MTRKEKRLKRIKKTETKKLRRWFYKGQLEKSPIKINIEDRNKNYHYGIFDNNDIKRIVAAKELLEKRPEKYNKMEEVLNNDK